jgi:hypothetical protein
MFDSSRAKTAGSQGGKSRSAAKKRAARNNGRAGGRQPTRTLAERLLGRKVRESERKTIAEAYGDLFEREKNQLETHFRVKALNDPLHTEQWRQANRKVPKDVQYAINRFKLAVRYHSRPLKQPKSYIVESQPCSAARRAAWEVKHRGSGLPCPPIRQKVHFEQMPHIEIFEWELRRGATLTVEDIMKIGGSRWTKRRAEGALAWLRGKSDQASDQAPEPK